MSHNRQQVNILIWYLEMKARPADPQRPLPPDATIQRANPPTLSFYRYLYDTVGEPYHWFARRQMDQAALTAIITHPQVEVYVLYASGTPAGYCELDRRKGDRIDLAYFGLLPEFVGRGYGLSFLQWGIATAWGYQPQRLTVNTCSLDHPNALSVYERAGFRQVGQERKLIALPEG